jgi:sugar O-acyltransferase (sialic acid O-acetyltransferase NeuD family)
MSSHNQSLYILGAGGHGQVACDVAVASGLFSEVTFLDSDYPLRRSHAGRVIAGDLKDLRSFVNPGRTFFVAIGDNYTRKMLFEALRDVGGSFAQLRSISSTISASSNIGPGTIVMPQATINAGARIGRNVIINTGSIVEHDCHVGDHSHLAPGSIIAGGVAVGCQTTIGAGAVVCPGVTIGDRILLGAGAVAVTDITCPGYYYGVPAKLHRVNDDG